MKYIRGSIVDSLRRVAVALGIPAKHVGAGHTYPDGKSIVGLRLHFPKNQSAKLFLVDVGDMFRLHGHFPHKVFYEGSLLYDGFYAQSEVFKYERYRGMLRQRTFATTSWISLFVTLRNLAAKLRAKGYPARPSELYLRVGATFDGSKPFTKGIEYKA